MSLKHFACRFGRRQAAQVTSLCVGMPLLCSSNRPLSICVHTEVLRGALTLMSLHPFEQ